jgi:tRNA A37 methylthiotransferase MiaB
MIDSIPDVEKSKRLQVLLDRQREIQRVNYDNHLGEVMEVMVEGMNPARGQITGRSSQNKPVNFTWGGPLRRRRGAIIRCGSPRLSPIAWLAKRSRDGEEKRAWTWRCAFGAG